MATPKDKQERKLDKPETSDNGEIKDAELDGVTGGNVLKTRHDTAKNAINNVR